MPIRNPTGATVIDDGSYIIISYEGTDILRLRKSDNQIEIQAGINTDISF